MAEVFPPRLYLTDSPDSEEDMFDLSASNSTPLSLRLSRFTLNSDNTESDDCVSDFCNTSASPLITHASETEDEVARPYAGAVVNHHNVRRERGARVSVRRGGELMVSGNQSEAELSVLALMVATFRRSLCNAGPEDGMDIGSPTNVRHVAHVTFDRFNGFLGLPVEFELEIPRRVPSASASVFGVSAESMQCSYDLKGNSVPTILLRMQEQLYTKGGLNAEGIFRINAENSHEEHVRDQLNKGLVPDDIDMHCLAGLIKAWFRELPRGVLDSLTPEQVMQCNSEEQCVELVKQLPPTEAALLDWAVNLMADVVQDEHVNKMNARNIAMVFAPNMTQMADPLTALMHAVQVMNFLKTLILRTLRERQEAALDPKPTSSCAKDLHEDSHDNDHSGALLNGFTSRDSSLREPQVKYDDYSHRKAHSKQQRRKSKKGGRLATNIDQQCERVEAW